MIIAIILTSISYLFGTYLAYQGLRSPIDRPLAYSNESILLALTLLCGWLPLAIAIYFAFKISLVFLIIIILARFIVAPTLLNNLFISLMNKFGF